MQYTTPPAIVRTLDEAPKGAAVQSAGVQRGVNNAAEDLAKLLQLSPSDVKASPELLSRAQRLETVTYEELARRNENQQNFHPIGTRVGEFRFKNDILSYQLEGTRSVQEVVCKLLHCPDPQLLDVEQVRSLAQVNRGSLQIQKVLLSFANSLAQGSNVSDAAFTGREEIVCSPGDAAGIHLKRLMVAVENLSESGATASNKQLDKTLDELEITRLFREAVHLRFVAQIEAINLPYEASLGKRIFAVTSAEVGRELASFDSLRERSQRNHLLTDQDRTTIQELLGQAQSLHLTARREAALAAAIVAALDRNLSSSLSSYHAAAVYGDEAVVMIKDNDAATAWSIQREEIIARARALVVRDIAYRTQVPSDRELKHIEGQLASITLISDAKLALAEGVSAAKGAVLLEPAGSLRTSKIRELERLEARLCKESLREMGVIPPTYEVRRESALAMPESERNVVFQGALRLLRDALERHDTETRNVLEATIKTLIDCETDPIIRHVRELDAITSVAVFAFEQPALLREGSVLLKEHLVATPEQEREALIAYLTTRFEDLKEARSTSRAELEKISAGDLEYARRSRDLGELERQLGRCITALQSGLAYNVVHAKDSQQKLAAFSKLEQLLLPNLEDELGALRSMQQEREILRETRKAGEGSLAASRDASQMVVLGRLQLVETSITRLSESIVWTAVYEAKVALEAHDPELTNRARMIIDSIPSHVQMEPSALRLVKAFTRDHQSPDELLALTKQFLYESVRDNPSYTYALMVALGLLGGAGAYATRRSPHLGFLLASSATLAATKALCIVTGLESMAAAYSTGLTFSTNGSSALDLFYLLSDAAQAGLLFGAYKGLKRCEQQGVQFVWPKNYGELLRAVRQEVAEYAKAGVYQLDPRRIGFYLIAVPLAVGGYYIGTSGARPEEQLSQAVTLAGEVVPILLIAILHDRIMARLQSTRRVEDLHKSQDT